MGRFTGWHTFFSRISLIASIPRIATQPKSLIARAPHYVTIDKMCSLTDWPLTGTLELMFATKRGLPIPHLPISHSAIALANPEDGRYAIYGRQSPFDFSMWYRDGFNIRTQKDNERAYLNRYFGFTVHPTGVFFNRDEIDYFLDSADKLVNQRQSCNMVNSNCYSYSITAMTFAINSILSRPTFDSAAIGQIIDVMEKHPLKDHLAIGVLNNTEVVANLLSVLEDVRTRLDGLEVKSEQDIELFNNLATLIPSIKQESQQYRIASLGSRVLNTTFS